MTVFLYCGPFSATNKEGRVLYENVEISLEESTLSLLEGPSGCGKSTLLRQIVALNPTRGVCYHLQGKDFSYKELTLWRSKVTLIAQDAPILKGSVIRNLTFPFDLKIAANKDFDQAKAQNLLNQVGLGYLNWDRDASTLSGGERHRLSIVRALLWDPPVLIFDEPISGLDQENREICFQLILDQARRPGRAVLCVLHDEKLAKLADQIFRLEDRVITRKK
ncbi:ATP-binding cassette domain-containing protein [Desulfohalobiaceae bacterium Ax17]|uniref:ABC transporter ATP-binding protein n=1 Tax=Desulfovulcanus ferrireducens TaxID=2831190 RepID=UPI00207BA857|nr:ATP-binding cassette domain-containing protein [Desulfovulcanus ferrireducens]MBT8764529.1 ATP-binding cassette domain-containing protein [Desulfovulcanus ferrireducens]